MSRVIRIAAVLLLLALSLGVGTAWAEQADDPEDQDISAGTVEVIVPETIDESPTFEQGDEEAVEQGEEEAVEQGEEEAPEQGEGDEEPPADGGGEGGSTAVSGEGQPGPAGLITVSSAAAELLVQVGDDLHYTLTVTNPGETPLTEVVVVDVVPSEVDVAGVPLNDAVESIQLGGHGSREDIVWSVGDLAAGESLLLEWIGTAVKAGDLTAVNRVQAASAETTGVQGSSRSYLGAVERQVTDNSNYTPIRRKVVTYTRPTVTKVLPAIVGPAPGTLPVTGMEVGPWFLAALSLIGTGLIALTTARRRVVVLLCVALALTACVADQRSSSPSDRPTEGSATDDEAEPEGETPEDRVLGRRFERDERPARGSGRPLEERVVEVLGDPVAHVEIVELSAGELPTDGVPSMAGDNVMTYVWDQTASVIVSAVSSRTVVRDATVELTTRVSDADGDIDVVVTLRNLSDDHSASVKGRLIHEVYGPGGLIARFESDPVDAMLAPGGETTATFTYVLPSGDYTAEASFTAA